MIDYIKIFTIFITGLMWLNYPQTAEARTVAPFFFNYVHQINTCKMESKKCNGCGEVKHLNNFNKEMQKKDGHSNFCKKCHSRQGLNYRRTKNGIVTTIYCTQKNKSKKRGHTAPKYSKDELKKWLFNHPKFNLLYKQWVDSNYDINKKPSIDRVNDFKGYSIDNIRLTTWSENNNKARRNRKEGVGTCSSQNKPVIGISKKSHKIFEFCSINQASRETGALKHHITNCCQKKQIVDSKGYKHTPKSAGGYYWKYKNEIK